jgi:hypothetical protein
MLLIAYDRHAMTNIQDTQETTMWVCTTYERAWSKTLKMMMDTLETFEWWWIYCRQWHKSTLKVIRMPCWCECARTII